MVASVADGIQESACEFSDSIWLPSADGLSRDQFSPNTQSDCSGGDEVKGGTLIHATGSDHRNRGKHRHQISDVTIATDVPTRNDFDEIGTQLPRSYDSRGGECSGNYDDIFLHGELYRLWIKAITGKKLSACIQASTGGFNVMDAACADNHLGCPLHEVRNYLESFGHGHGDFDDRDPSAGDRLSSKEGIFRRRHANGGNDPELFDPASYFLLVQKSGSLDGGNKSPYGI